MVVGMVLRTKSLHRRRSMGEGLDWQDTPVCGQQMSPNKDLPTPTPEAQVPRNEGKGLVTLSRVKAKPAQKGEKIWRRHHRSHIIL